MKVTTVDLTVDLNRFVYSLKPSNLTPVVNKWRLVPYYYFFLFPPRCVRVCGAVAMHCKGCNMASNALWQKATIACLQGTRTLFGNCAAFSAKIPVGTVGVLLNHVSRGLGLGSSSDGRGWCHRCLAERHRPGHRCLCARCTHDGGGDDGCRAH